MKNKKVDSIVKNVEHYFDFLHAKGYETRTADYSPHPNGSWVVQYESQVCAIYITNDRDYISIEFSPINKPDWKNRINIERIVYMLSEGQRIIKPFKGNLAWEKNKQLERLSKLLEEYIDQITNYFENELNRNRTT